MLILNPFSECLFPDYLIVFTKLPIFLKPSLDPKKGLVLANERHLHASRTLSWWQLSASCRPDFLTQNQTTCGATWSEDVHNTEIYWLGLGQMHRVKFRSTQKETVALLE